MDGGHETRGEPRRVLAMLIYLNEVPAGGGGETAFLAQVCIVYSLQPCHPPSPPTRSSCQGVAVAPRCGRVTIFPTAFTHVHAGRPPVLGRKYAVSEFIRI